MKNIIFCIGISLMLSSCLDHLLEPDKTENKEESVGEANSNIAKEVEDIAVPVVMNKSGRFPFASQRLLTSDELHKNKYSKFDLSIMRNEIFARHGYKFEAGGEMDQYFRMQNWYQPKLDDVSSLLSEVEKQNIDLILKTSQALDNSSVANQDNIPQMEEEAGGYGSILVENLRLRDKPALDGETIALLKKDSFVTVKEESAFKTTIELNGTEISDVWFKIISQEGKMGWVHGCCIDVTWP